MQQISYEEIVKVQPKGLITIPIGYRRKIGLTENSFVRLLLQKGRLVIEPADFLPYPTRKYNNDEVDEFFELDQKESAAK